MSSSFGDAIQRAWYQGSNWLLPLRPLSWLVAFTARRRLKKFRKENLAPPVPILVIGNITVGGTGKTPLVVSLCEYFVKRDLRVVVISRGYRAKPPYTPWLVTADQDAEQAGDEPLLIARRTGVPVIISPKRKQALDLAIKEHSPDIVISDDGLQHYELPRSAEILVLDGRRLLGNGHCLPAGPLREPALRLTEVDWLIVNGEPEKEISSDTLTMKLVFADPVNVRTGKSLHIEDFIARYPFVHGVAGIGHPDRFFSALRDQGLAVEPHPFTDHHAFSHADLDRFGTATVLMTEKDAVKCAKIAGDNVWYVPVSAKLPTVFFESVYEKLMRSKA
ncbi:MAG: tetraacyldisaccharide 4'-kinase [Alcanivoracaceae bacterium]|nr:tetraacyldisaccharide 4'-kinase [Alcanivoracaceae bacterium]